MAATETAVPSGRWKRRHGAQAIRSSSPKSDARKETGTLARDRAEGRPAEDEVEVGFWSESAEAQEAKACEKRDEVEELLEDTDFTEELELLRAMWPDEGELSIDYPAGLRARVRVQVEPLTAGESLDQFVRCQLAIEIPKGYPHAPLAASICSSRGLSCGQEIALLGDLSARAAELVGDPALYLLVETGKELLTAYNAPRGDCAICLRDLCPPAAPEDVEHTLSRVESSFATEVARTPCFHAFHVKCLASYWQSEWERQLQDRGSKVLELVSKFSIRNASVCCPECRTALPWEEMPQLHAALEDVEAMVGECLQHPPDTVPSAGALGLAGSPETTAQATGAPTGRRQRRRQAKDKSCTDSGFVWMVEIQNSDTAHAGTPGICSMKLVAMKGESEEVTLNQGGGMKSGELVKVEARVATDLGDLIYVELKNTSAETWRPHWIKVFAPDGKESFIFSRQWVAKGRTQKAYAEVSGSVGLRGLPSKAGSGKINSAAK